MSVWNPSPNTAPMVGGTAPTDAWRKQKPKIPKAPEQKPIFQKRPTAMLLEDDCPTKIPTLNNGTLFDLLPMDIINVIDA